MEPTYGMQNSGKTINSLRDKAKGKPFRVFPFFVVFFLGIQLSGFAQKHDIGLGLGAANYTGELERSYNLLNHRPGGWAFYRYNLNHAISFRGSLSIGWLSGSDQPKLDAFARERSQAFDVTLGELAATFEYNFLDYKNPKARIRWSPYFFGGLALFRSSGYARNERATDYSAIQAAIPVGIGFKYRLTPYLTLGYEWGARKTFFDYIDNVGAYLPEETGGIKDFQYGNIHQKDWYYFTGFTLSYTFWNIPCPFSFE